MHARLGERDAATKLFEQASTAVVALRFNSSSQWLKLARKAADAGYPG